MAIKKSKFACVYMRNASQYDPSEQCGPWASCLSVFYRKNILRCSSQKSLGQKISNLYGRFITVIIKFVKIMILGGRVGPHLRIKCKYIEKTFKYRLLGLR
jgi:hypothetical protein